MITCPTCNRTIDDYDAAEFHYHSYVVAVCQFCAEAHALMQARRLTQAEDRTVNEDHWINTFLRRIATAVIQKHPSNHLLDWARQNLTDM